MKIALVQMNSGGDIAENIATLTTMVQQAAASGTQLVATPENSFRMEVPGEPRLYFPQAEHPGLIAASQLAKKHKLWLLIGSAAVSAHGDKPYNRSVLFNPEGQDVAHYDKIHLFDVELGAGESYSESSRFGAGDTPVVASTPWGGLGLSICYDVRFAHLYRNLAKQGAQILSVPAAFTVPTGEAHWHVLLRARAIEHGCFVIAPAQTGTHPGGRKTYGHSLIIDPWGEVLADGGTDVGLITAELDLDMVAQVRGKLPSLTHDRPF